MLSFSGSLKVFVAVEPCDMRRSFNGLHDAVCTRLAVHGRAFIEGDFHFDAVAVRVVFSTLSSGFGSAGVVGFGGLFHSFRPENWGFAPDPRIFRAWTNAPNEAPFTTRKGVSPCCGNTPLLVCDLVGRIRSGYALAGCFPAVPASFWPENCCPFYDAAGGGRCFLMALISDSGCRERAAGGARRWCRDASGAA